MHTKNEYIIKVYEDGNIRIPSKVRQNLSITKGSNLIMKINQHGDIKISTIAHKIDELRNEIKKCLNNPGSLVDEFLEFKQQDDSKYI